MVESDRGYTPSIHLCDESPAILPEDIHDRALDADVGQRLAIRREVLAAIGVKPCQRIGHRYRVVELRTLTDLDSPWTAVDTAVNGEDCLLYTSDAADD